MADRLGIPLRVRLHARLVRPFSGRRWRRVWVRYWESQGISEEQQMEWSRAALEEEEGGPGAAPPGGLP